MRYSGNLIVRNKLNIHLLLQNDKFYMWCHIINIIWSRYKFHLGKLLHIDSMKSIEAKEHKLYKLMQISKSHM